MSYLDDIEAWAAAQLHRADVDRAHIRKLVVVARAVRSWREAKCAELTVQAPRTDAGYYDCNGDEHLEGCPVRVALDDIRAADLALEIP